MLDVALDGVQALMQVMERAAVTRQNRLHRQCLQPANRAEIVAQRIVLRRIADRDRRRCAAHDMVGREQELAIRRVQTYQAGGVTWTPDNL